MSSQMILFISDIVSIITVTLSFILKVPQILRLFKSGTSSGISLPALILELSSYTTTMMYNYTKGHAILTYLEYPVLLLQEYIIIGLVMFFGGHSVKKFLKLVAFYVAITSAFAVGLLPHVILGWMVPLTIPIGALSKSMQLFEIIRRSNADSVSALTWFLSFFTNVTRIFTVYVDSADTTLLYNFSISSFFSLSVLLATIYYQRASRSKID